MTDEEREAMKETERKSINEAVRRKIEARRATALAGSIEDAKDDYFIQFRREPHPGATKDQIVNAVFDERLKIALAAPDPL